MRKNLLPAFLLIITVIFSRDTASAQTLTKSSAQNNNIFLPAISEEDLILKGFSVTPTPLKTAEQKKQLTLGLGISQQNFIDYVASPNEYRGHDLKLHASYEIESLHHLTIFQLHAGIGTLTNTRGNVQSFKFDSVYTLVNRSNQNFKLKITFDKLLKFNTTSAVKYAAGFGIEYQGELNVKPGGGSSYTSWIHGLDVAAKARIDFELNKHSDFRVDAGLPLLSFVSRPPFSAAMATQDPYYRLKSYALQFTVATPAAYIHPNVCFQYIHHSTKKVNYNLFVSASYLRFTKPRVIKTLSQEVGMAVIF